MGFANEMNLKFHIESSLVGTLQWMGIWSLLHLMAIIELPTDKMILLDSFAQDFSLRLLGHLINIATQKDKFETSW